MSRSRSGCILPLSLGGPASPPSALVREFGRREVGKEGRELRPGAQPRISNGETHVLRRERSLKGELEGADRATRRREGMPQMSGGLSQRIGLFARRRGTRQVGTNDRLGAAQAPQHRTDSFQRQHTTRFRVRLRDRPATPQPHQYVPDNRTRYAAPRQHPVEQQRTRASATATQSTPTAPYPLPAQHRLAASLQRFGINLVVAVQRTQPPTKRAAPPLEFAKTLLKLR